MNDYMVEVVKVLRVSNEAFNYNRLNKSVVTYSAMVVDTNSGKKMWKRRIAVTSQLDKAPSLYEIEQAVFSDLTINGFTVPKGLKCLFKEYIGKTEEDDGDGIY